MPKTLHLFDGTTSHEVDLPSWNLSRIYELPSGPLDLALLTDPVDNPKKLPSGAPKASVPGDMVDFYLLVSEDPENKVVPVKIKVIQAGVKHLTPGQMLWVNLTDYKVNGKLGSETLIVEPQSQMTMNSPVKENADYSVSLAYRIPDNETTYPLCETRWGHNSRSRAIALIFTQTGSRIPRVSVFHDYRVIAPKEPAAP